MNQRERDAPNRSRTPAADRTVTDRAAAAIAQSAAGTGHSAAATDRRQSIAARSIGKTIRTRIRVLVGAVCVVAGLAGLASPMMTGEVHAEAAGSAVTVHGTGEFASLTVTVGQTKDLVDQRVHLSWAGGAPTVFKGSEFAANFLQFMQCWGDPVTGPDRTQCEYGVLNDGRNAAFGPDTRRLDTQYPPTTPDPITAPNVPFRGVDGSVATVYSVASGDPAGTTTFTQLFDRQSTNEIAYAQSASDGTGQADFETETTQEAPRLGCGEAVMTDSAGHPYSCFLVVVPRGTTEIDGKPYSDVRHPEKELVSSPLAAANWANHIAVPLTFLSETDACPSGQQTYPIVGSEQMAEAMRLWTPEACHVTAARYNLIRLSDDQARGQLAAADPGMSFVGRAVSPDDLPPSGPVVYAPVALSGLTIAYEIDQSSSYSASDAVKVHDGTPLTGMKLTPRLVAKLLTQSYRNGVSVFAPEMQPGGVLANNPTDLSNDPEFQALNPQFNGLMYSLWVSDSVITPGTGADAISSLWSWINGDPDARAFLDGAPVHNADGSPGMVVNPNYKGMSLPISSFVPQDPFCYVPRPDAVPPSPALCAPDLHPSASSMLVAGRGIARGNNLAKTIWVPTNNPPSYEGSVQTTGQHSLMGVVDTATAQRFGLQTALLQNASGAFAAADEAGLTAAVRSMPTVNGVQIPDPRTTTPDAYPLAHLTYAATVPSGLKKEEGAAYADFLAYAVAKGQVSGASIGTLAPGYVPLPTALRTRATTAAANIRAQAGVAITATSTSSPTPTLPSGSTRSSADGPGQVINVVIPSSHAAGTTAPTTASAAAPTGRYFPPAGGSTAPVRPASSGSSTVAAAVTGGVNTPKPKPSSAPGKPNLTAPSKLGAVRLTLLVLLIAGGALILAGPALRSWAAKIPHRAIPPGVHLE